ncbi:HTH-type transcriptional activator Btr [Cohnella xylanilytica]|nr:HTH-type transcriptional activator Btr [Cohnella xylanilytica]
MATEPTDVQALSACIYRLSALHAWSRFPEEIRHRDTLHTILIVLAGRGIANIDGYRCELGAGKAYLIPPSAFYQFHPDPEEPVDCRLLEFAVWREQEGRIARPAVLGPAAGLTIAHLPPILSLLEEMETKLAGEGFDRMRADIAFQELLVSLFEQWTIDSKPAPERTIRTIVEYMERNYSRPLTRDLLARMAGMSADYFNRAFKKTTGRTPMDYLTDIRIRHAEKALALSDDGYRSIAQSVGFNDEFYFSRKFKKATGLSPSAYAGTRKGSRKIAALQHHLTGHLLALGIAPHGALINGYYPLGEPLKETRAVGSYYPELDKLVGARPDLILTYDYWDEETEPKAKLFDKIAPTVTIPFYDDWREQLGRIAKATGKEREASLWLERYERKALRVRSRIRDRVGDDSLLVVGLGNGRMCVFGRRTVGAVAYGDLGIRAPEGIGDIEEYAEIEPEDLFAYDADRLLFVSFRNDGSAETKAAIAGLLRRLREDPRWPRLRAARSGRVYSLLDDQHLYTLYTSYSHELLLDKLPELFEGVRKPPGGNREWR